MKFKDLLKENIKPSQELTNKEINKLKKIRAAFKSGKVNWGKNDFIFELSDNYIPYKNQFGDIGLMYYPRTLESCGLDVYEIVDGEKISIYKNMNFEGKWYVFGNGFPDDANKESCKFNSVLEHLRDKLRKFNINLWIPF